MQLKENKMLISPIEQSPYYGAWLTNDTEIDIATTFVEKRMGNFNREDIKEVVSLMKMWKQYIGLPQVPNGGALVNGIESELLTVIQFLYDNFKHITITDLKLARDWAVMGKTDLSKVSKKTLSAEYVSRCIMLYEEKKREIITEIIRNKTSYDRMQESNNMSEKRTPQQKAESFKEIIMNHYDSFKKNVLFVDFGDFVYNWIKNNRLFKVDSDFKAKADAYATSRYSNEKSEINIAKVISGEPLQKDSKSTEEAKLDKYRKHFVIISFFEQYDNIEIVKMIQVDQFK